jgi:hypothetical protein
MKLDREAQEYLVTRENDVQKGFEQYGSGHKNWQELTKPFQPVLQQYPDVNPVQLMQNLMHNHLQILQGTPEQKVNLARQLLKSYGIDLPGVDSANPAPGNFELQSLRQELSEAKQTLRSLLSTQQELSTKDSLKVVQAFAAKPENKYFAQVAPDVLRFLQTGAAETLEAAYELACYANPSVRAELMKTPSSPPAAPKLPNVDGSKTGTPGKRTTPTNIDDTIQYMQFVTLRKQIRIPGHDCTLSKSVPFVCALSQDWRLVTTITPSRRTAARPA